MLLLQSTLHDFIALHGVESMEKSIKLELLSNFATQSEKKCDLLRSLQSFLCVVESNSEGLAKSTVLFVDGLQEGSWDRLSQKTFKRQRCLLALDRSMTLSPVIHYRVVSKSIITFS